MSDSSDRPRRRWYDPLGVPPEQVARSRAVPPVGDAVRALAARRGWQSHLVAGDLHSQWEAIVGPQLAGHTAPLRLQGGVLVLAAATPLWAAEVRQLGSVITRRVNERLGEGTVRTITVSVRRSKTR
ncbi:MAG: DUF721 domain-containing protein [Actinobacteria bacterium]|nr:DUF721 domain-containing protein [Actinomycetota bacterium]